MKASGPHLAISSRHVPAGGLMMAIPKKQVPSAPVRNMIRRVIRESYRACGDSLEGVNVLVKLTRMPIDPDRAVPPGARAFVRRPTDRALKRLVRAEIDALFSGLAADLRRRSRRPAATPSCSPGS